MPLSLRTVEPTEVSLNRIPEPEVDPHGRRRGPANELQCVANGTLSNLIRQLSNLSTHVEHLMTDLSESVTRIDQRIEALAERGTHLQQKYHEQNQQQKQERNSNKDGLANNHLRKAFQTAQLIDQHSLSRQTLPAAMAELYNRCDPPPRLNDLNEFREDGKPALSLYTDPGYFFNLWKEQIFRECENDRRMRSARAHAAASNLPNAQGERSPTKRRKQQQMATTTAPHLRSNVLLNHYSSANTLSINGIYNSRSGLAGGGSRVGNGEFMQFPTEYQAPQVMRQARNDVLNAPPGMSRPLLHEPTVTASATMMYDDEPLPPPPVAASYNAPPMTTYPLATVAPLNSIEKSSATDGEGQMSQAMSQMNMMSNGAEIFTPTDTASTLPHIDDDDELPPPPPPLSSHGGTIGVAGGLHFLPPGAERIDSTVTNGANNASSVESAPQSTITASNSLTESTLIVQSSFQTNTTQSVNSSEENQGLTNPIISASTSTTLIDAVGDQVHDNEEQSRRGAPSLLQQIQAGVKLKKLQKEEAVRKPHAPISNDIAAILDRRMRILANAASSSSEEDNNGDDDEWEE